MSRAACLALGLAAAGLCGNALAEEKARRPLAIVYVTDEGCVAAGAHQDRVEWLDDQRAAYHLHLMLNSRERIHEGPVEVDIEPGKVIAYVPVQVTEPAAGQPVATCVRPVALQLVVEPIQRGSYDWQFRRGTRAEAATREAEARAKASGTTPAAEKTPPEAAPAIPRG